MQPYKKIMSTNFPCQQLLKYVNWHFKEFELTGGDSKRLFKDGDKSTYGDFSLHSYNSLSNAVIIIHFSGPEEREPESLSVFPKGFYCSHKCFSTTLSSLGYTVT